MAAERGAGQIRDLGSCSSGPRARGRRAVCCGAAVQAADRRRAAGTESRGGLSLRGCAAALSCPAVVARCPSCLRTRRR